MATTKNERTITVNESDFEREVLRADVPVLVDFWAEWCGPCKVLGPTIDELAADYEGRIKVAKLNIDENRGIAATYGIRSIPTVKLFDGGEVKETFVGLLRKQEYSATLDALVA
ncbi:MAG: thioredoxin [Chloroflexi bacterium]|nr:thioredoxin [Chloroflexota bacterium]